ncbi:outer membrane protein assembly factor BamB family protein [Halorussus litoreus]|uniref:outer membrane protein assembly factor BamB family protein n=1 Tax=Halorussus litoreus TaxID=1710536 RepID=UPI0018E51C36|nr:PQQ-binding-like beta-propeller repeat protein [Halorussus litoreus]
MVPSSSRRTALLGIGSAVVGSTLFGSTASFADRLGSAESVGERGGQSTDDSPSSTAHDWPMARYDAAGTGYSPDASGPGESVRVKWRREPDDFSGGTGSPILVGGTVYATSGTLVALDAETGETRFSTQGSYRSSPARADARAYQTDTLAVASPRGVFGLNAGGGLRLLGREFGVERWHGPRSESRTTLFGPPTAPPPVVVDGRVYAAIPGTDHVVALDASSGRELWRASPDDELRRPAVRDGRLFAVNWPYQVTAYDAATGERDWQTQLDEQMVLAPTATSDAVVVPDRLGVTTLDASDGSLRWRFDHDGNATEGAATVAEDVPADSEDTVFVQSAGGDGRLHAVDLATGEERWSAPVSGEGTPVVADSVVYAAGHREIVAFDATAGDVRWRHETRLPVSTPAVGDGALYATTHGQIIALEADR